MSVLSNKARLTASTRELAVQWDQTKETWRDDQARQFEHDYIEPLKSSVDAAMDIIDQLDKLVLKIRSDCE